MSRFLAGGDLISRCLLFAIVLLLILGGSAHAQGPIFHSVSYGETLYSIARRYDTSPDALARMNGLTTNSWVYVGQVLRVSANTSSPTTPAATPAGQYPVRAGDTLLSIAAYFKVDVVELARANNIPDNGYIYVGWKLKIPASKQTNTPTNRTYIVQRGDSLAAIALDYDTTVPAIVIANDLQTDWLIVPGQRLIIPERGAQTNPTLPASNPPVSNSSINDALNLRLTNVPLYRQRQTLTCEEAAAAMALHGAAGESRIVNAVPRSDNPFLGIRGRTNAPVLGSLTDYGTYAHGLQSGLAALGYKSNILYGQTYVNFKEAIIANLRGGKAVIWWNTWRDSYQKPVWVKTSSGAFVKLVPYEHTVVIVGANERGVTYHDPYDATVRFATWATHQRVSAYFDNMGLVIQ